MPKHLPTSERLARALEVFDDPKLAPMVERARAGYYDDFKSPLATPIVQLYMDLIEAGYPVMASRVRKGEFDSTFEEGLEWWEQEGKKTFGVDPFDLGPTTDP